MQIIILGGGIVGLAIARELSMRGYIDITVIEKEAECASHQSSRNSGVMHAGLYYKPNSKKALLCRKGIKLLKEYCTKKNIPWDECGKLVVATSKGESERLENLYENGKQNGLIGISIINSKQVQKIEPYVSSLGAIHVPEESIVDYKAVAKSYENDIRNAGAQILLKSEFESCIKRENKNFVMMKDGRQLEYDLLINSSGLYSDKNSRKLGLSDNNSQILPFRGEYYLLKKEYRYLVKNLIYPVPDPSLPFLGVHLTRMINGEIEAGPNAVLALAREGYNWKTINLKEFSESIFYPGLYKFVANYPLITLGELSRSFIKNIFVESLRKFIPELSPKMVYRSQAGVRAQLMYNNGNLENDFVIKKSSNCLSILNAPSPAATSSLAIAEYVVDLIK